MIANASSSNLGLYPNHGYQFLLFHRQHDACLEAIKLTGDRNVPRGAHTVIVENLKDIKRTCMEEWQGKPVVTAKAQLAEDGFVNSTNAAP